MSKRIKAAIKKTICVFISVFLVICLCACDSDEPKYPTATEKFFVNDFANVMTDSDIEAVYTMGAALNDATTAQAVIITVENLGGEEASEYALNIGREWGVGTAEDDNGVVILLSRDDREIEIAVGYGLEGALPDSKVGRIIDTYGMPYFSADQFSTGLVSVYNSIINEIYIEYNITPDENYIPMTYDDEDETVSFKKVALSWLALVLLVIIYMLIFGRRGGLFVFGAPRFFGGGFNNHNNFGGGGFGGFTGGGGSFGGGGAGRKF